MKLLTKTASRKEKFSPSQEIKKKKRLINNLTEILLN